MKWENDSLIHWLSDTGSLVTEGGNLTLWYAKTDTRHCTSALSIFQ